MALPNPTDGTTVAATDVSDIKNHLEGGSAKTAPYHLKQSSGSFQITLSEAAGATYFRLNDSAGSAIFTIDSDGNVVVVGMLTNGTFVFPLSATPTLTTEGSAAFDTDDNTLKIYDGAATKEFGYLGTSTPAALGTAAAGTSKETSHADHVHPGPTYRYKSSTQVFTADTTFADITAASGSFAFAIGANEVWAVRYVLQITPAGTGGVKLQLTGPAAPIAVTIIPMVPIAGRDSTSTAFVSPTVSGLNIVYSPDQVVTAFSSSFAAHNAAAGATNDTYGTIGSWVYVDAIIQNGANAGTVTLQGAQNSSNSTTTFGLGCFMRAEKIS